MGPNSDNINPSIKANEYAIRGPMPSGHLRLKKEIEKGVKKPFMNVIKANIGDPHAMGNPAVTFIRQVLALILICCDRLTFPTMLSYALIRSFKASKEEASARTATLLESR